MKRFFKILWLKLSIKKLKNRRSKVIVDISINNPKGINIVGEIENINPIYLKEIDKKIESRKRLISSLSKAAIKRANELSTIALMFL